MILSQFKVILYWKPSDVIFATRRYMLARYWLSLRVRLFVCLSVTSQSSTKTAIHVGSRKQRCTIAQIL